MKGVYPGSFDPPTVAHLAIAEAARDAGHLDRVDLVLSHVALGKEDRHRVRLEDRLGVLEEIAAARPWLRAAMTDSQLLVDVAAGYDVLVVGADKWAQVVDPAWYGGSASARDEALARLPRTLVVPRPPHPVPQPTDRIELLDLGQGHHGISSSEVLAGRHEWMAPEAAAFDRRTGGWTDPDRYLRWLATTGAS